MLGTDLKVGTGREGVGVCLAEGRMGLGLGFAWVTVGAVTGTHTILGRVPVSVWPSCLFQIVASFLAFSILMALFCSRRLTGSEEIAWWGRM